VGTFLKEIEENTCFPFIIDIPAILAVEFCVLLRRWHPNPYILLTTMNTSAEGTFCVLIIAAHVISLAIYGLLNKNQKFNFIFGKSAGPDCKAGPQPV
jgi:hypothetical protein